MPGVISRHYRSGFRRGSRLGYAAGYAASLEAGRIAGKEAFQIPFDGTSIIIPTYNQREYLLKCIRSIRKNTRIPYELIVIDNGSTDGTVEKLRAEFAGIRIRRNSENLGFAPAVNQGLMMARGTTLLLLNNDTVVTEQWLENLLACLRSNPDFGLVGPVSNRISGEQRIKTSYRSIREMIAFARSFNRRSAERWKRTDHLMGFCLLFTRDMFHKLGYFDEGFKIGNCEDIDYGMRARLLGSELVIAGDTFVHHYGSISIRSIGKRFVSINEENKRFFSVKWEGYSKLKEEISRLAPGNSFAAARLYPSHVTVKGADGSIYWIENEIRHRIDQADGFDGVRLSVVDLRYWREGSMISGTDIRNRLGLLNQPGASPSIGTLLQTPDGQVYQVHNRGLRRLANKKTLELWRLNDRMQVPISWVEKSEFEEFLPIVPPPTVYSSEL
ncbi:glycosyltransferase family 2 protein [Paenibacillus arenilitoris]|uniref:Glycosyltransferase family 2 protein n=1 Tax=Paenibacillus arenilitoris TaxID=2772299 RepID=A0A927CQZ9_9BACL|nr:glycosyltransferase family 2 protein [Paenibacillus arenilitoris]MBD2871507.1 glycosyltransferase family 2 protein [Paenibacillus arenilitoris]